MGVKIRDRGGILLQVASLLLAAVIGGLLVLTILLLLIEPAVDLSREIGGNK